MAIEPKRIPFEEFSENLIRILGLVLANNETIIVENVAGERVAVSPVSSPVFRPKTDDDLAVFFSAAGSWSDIDTDALLEDSHVSRKLSLRPPVIL